MDKNTVDNIVKNAMTDAADTPEANSSAKSSSETSGSKTSDSEKNQITTVEPSSNESSTNQLTQNNSADTEKAKEKKPATESADQTSEQEKNSTDNKNEKSQVNSLENKETENKKPKNKKTENKKSGSLWLIIILLLLILCGIAAIGYVLWMQDQKIQQLGGDSATKTTEIDSQVNQLESNVATLNSTINNNITSQLDNQQSAIADLVKENNLLKQQIAGQREQWAALTSTTNDDWKLAEAHYLTRLAGQRIVMERNSQGALALLQAADEILQKLSDPDLFSVREQLAEDITSLKLISSVDREGIFLSLSAMSKALVKLPSPVPQNYENMAIEPEKPSLETPTGLEIVKQSLQKAVSALQGYIRITRHDEPLQALIPAEGQAYLQNSLRLTIETAQLALLKEQQNVFEESLDKASQLLREYYPFSKEAESLVGDLTALKQQTIVQELPDITQSQKALGAYIEKLHRLNDVSERQASAVTAEETVE